MITIPDNLKKYFLSPNHHLTLENSYYYKINQYLLDQMRCGVKQDVVSTHLIGKKHPYFFQINNETCDYAFTSSCWGTLKDDEKARIIYLLMHNLMKKQFPDTSIPSLHFIASQELSHIKADAMYHHKRLPTEQDFVLITPEHLAESNGITVANLLAHELQHHYDFSMVDKEILPNFKEHYLPDSPDFMLKDNIMALNISGELYNHKTGKLDPLTPELQEQILMLKHKFHPLTTKATIRDFSQVKSIDDMLLLMEFQAYMNTPLERKAYATGLKCADSILDNSLNFGIKKTHIDTLTLENIRRNVNNTTENAQKITELTGTEITYICNLFHEKSYYSSKLIKDFTTSSRLNEINKELIKLANCFSLSEPYQTIELQ